MPRSLVPNLNVQRSPSAPRNEKVYCHDDYAQSLYDLIVGATPSHHIVNKDIASGETGTVIGYHFNHEASSTTVELPGGIPVIVSGSREDEYSKHVEIVIHPVHGIYCEWKFQGSTQARRTVEIEIINTEPYLTGSFYDAHIRALKQQLRADLTKDRPNWYTALILEKNKGGFVVNLGGIRAFLPGSLAAANKIVDFDSYIGREVRVMVDGYDAEKESFVVSNKKYIAYALPETLRSLDLSRQYTATVTGVGTTMSKTDGRVPYGIFLEFEGILTGLLHVSEMDNGTHDDLLAHNVSAGQTVSVWVKEITKDSRIILTQVDPAVRRAEISELKQSIEGLILEGTVRAVKDYGCLIDLGSGLTGLLPKNETRRMRIQPEIKMVVSVQEVNSETGKILLAKAPRPIRERD